MKYDQAMARYRFISHALNGDGPFRPNITYDSYGKPADVDYSYIVRYPRESDAKHARRVEVAFYASPLARVTSRFTGYITTQEIIRDIGQDELRKIADDVDGKGNAIDVFWQQFMLDAKARGSMLLLVDSPKVMPQNRAEQVRQRMMPFWTPITPEIVTDYEVSDNGKFEVVEFAGRAKDARGEWQKAIYYFDRSMWSIHDRDGKIIEQGEHGLGECPVLAFTEMGDFPSFGPFASIADLSKRLYNLDSELDEILRSQTFSILTQQVPENSSAKEQLEAAKVTGETIGASNMLCYTGTQPGFIAPPDGPATVYMERIRDLRQQIQEIGMDVADTNMAESGKAKQLRFQALNGELAKFSERMEDFERRAWELTTRWLGMEQQPQIAWPRDFNVADVLVELEILREMRDTGMPEDVLKAQQIKVIYTNFAGIDQDDMEILVNSLNNDRSMTA